MRIQTPLLFCAIAMLQTAFAASESMALPESQTFIHPGLLHTRADLDYIKQKLVVKDEPWLSAFEKLRTHPHSRLEYRMRGPFETVTRDPHRSIHNDEMATDGNAAYQNALIWCLTGDEAHAKKAVAILNAWGHTLKKIDGHDVQLAAGLYGFKYVSAAELIRHTYPKWEQADIIQFQAMLSNAVYPPIKDFATFANGNWDGACMKTLLAIAVFNEDRALFNRVLEYYQNGSGNGSITHYIVDESGQCQESGRDQTHTQLGLAQLAEVCECAWHQGVDLYGAENNRLLKGFEYTAKYNLGEDVPFKPYTDLTGKLKSKLISPLQRGALRPIFEMALNHYANRKGVAAPFTKQAAEKLRPEGAGFGADEVGFGTLLFWHPAGVTGERR